MQVSPDAILGAVVTIGLVLATGLWKLATMLAEVRGQVRHNGGSSLKDDARTAAVEAAAAREAADIARLEAAKVAIDLSDFRQHQADDAAERRLALSKLQHDLTNVRVGQEHLLEQQLATDGRVTDHRDRNAATVASLQQAVDQLAADSLARDKALGDALQESLDVALITAEADQPPDQ